MKMTPLFFHLHKKQLTTILRSHFLNIKNRKNTISSTSNTHRHTHLYTIDHSRITGSLRNYDPIKQYFCLLPYTNTSRSIIVPQDYLIHFDDFLLPCNVPTIIAKSLTVMKHLVSAPFNDKEKSYYTVISKQAYSYNELMFISAKIIAFMVNTEKAKSETQYTTPEHYTPKPPTTTTDKLNNVLTSRTLRDLT